MSTCSPPRGSQLLCQVISLNLELLSQPPALACGRLARAVDRTLRGFRSLAPELGVLRILQGKVCYRAARPRGDRRQGCRVQPTESLDTTSTLGEVDDPDVRRATTSRSDSSKERSGSKRGKSGVHHGVEKRNVVANFIARRGRSKNRTRRRTRRRKGLRVDGDLCWVSGVRWAGASWRRR